jgi:hypothetical protein
MAAVNNPNKEKYVKAITQELGESAQEEIMKIIKQV